MANLDRKYPPWQTVFYNFTQFKELGRILLLKMKEKDTENWTIQIY